MKKFSEFNSNEKLVHNHNDVLIEMARINDKKSFKYDVFVNGGDSYGSGRNEHGEPHFHFSDNIKNPQKFSISILIPTKIEWEQNKELYICQPDNFNWNGLKKEKSDLISWLDLNNKHMPTMTNLEMIRLQWNILNSDNKNVRQLIL